MKYLSVFALTVLLVPFPAGGQNKGAKKALAPQVRLAQRIEKVRSRLAEVAVPDSGARALEGFARQYLDDAQQRLADEKMLSAEGLTQAADALTRAVDHIRHSRIKNRKDYPPREDQATHLERAYFRLQQADYFLRQSKDPRAKTLPRTARQYYQKARQAYDQRESQIADEFTKVSEEIVKALEHLAHTATPVREPPRLK